MPQLLPVSELVTLDQVQCYFENSNNPNVRASQLNQFLIKINSANANLAALNLNRALLYLQEREECEIIAAAEASLIFLNEKSLNFQTQQSLAKQLGIYYAYYKCDHEKAQKFFITFLHNITVGTLEDAQAFMYMAYTNSLQENFHDDSHLQKAIEILDGLSKNETLTRNDTSAILIDRGYANFLLGLFHYRKSYLIASEDKGVYLEKAAEFLQRAIDCQTEALTNTDDLDLKTQVLFELTHSYRLACVISYRMNAAGKTAAALQKAQEVEAKVVFSLHQIQMTTFFIRSAVNNDKYGVEFNNILSDARLQTGSSTVSFGMYANSVPSPVEVDVAYQDLNVNRI